MRNQILVTLVLVVLTSIFSCKKKDAGEALSPSSAFTKDKISGVSQKGPFLNGSSLTAFELDENFAQTGKSFNTQILDNLGSFELNNITLLTHYAKLGANGYFFNETKNINSLSPIQLYALSDLSNKSTVNVNLLSTLEVSRVEYLISNGASFTEAKHQAQQEILNMFYIHIPSLTESELLNISVDGDNNAGLLAVSLILQGYRSEAELSQLLGDISTDIRTDGILNSPSLGSQLINDARLLDTIQIRHNIENKYLNLGITTVIPHFENYIKQFLDSCTYTFTNFVTFPQSGTYGVNLLNETDSVFSTNGAIYSLCANLPAGTHLKISHANNGVTGYLQGSEDGWADISTSGNMTLVSTKSGLIDLHAGLYSSGNVTIDFYENNSTTPTRSKTIYVQ